MPIKYKSKRSNSFGYFLLTSTILVGFASIGLPILAGDSQNTTGMVIGIIITTLTGLLFLWIWLDTNYCIKDELLIAKSGPVTWRIPIKEITTVRLHQKTIGGLWKLTLSWNCIEIEYNRNGSISISPDKEDDFIEQLKCINDILVVK